LSRSKLIRKLKEKNPNLSQIEIELILNNFSESIEKSLLDNKKVELRGFGTFFLKKIKEKFGSRNPKTGEIIYVPEKNKVRFRASKKLKDFINQ
tara:strand:+ start:116 stop:397 length:282 start_codon:yes stop_codon:yes gene_type:complete